MAKGAEAEGKPVAVAALRLRVGAPVPAAVSEAIGEGEAGAVAVGAATEPEAEAEAAPGVAVGEGCEVAVALVGIVGEGSGDGVRAAENRAEAELLGCAPEGVGAAEGVAGSTVAVAAPKGEADGSTVAEPPLDAERVAANVGVGKAETEGGGVAAPEAVNTALELPPPTAAVNVVDSVGERVGADVTGGASARRVAGGVRAAEALMVAQSVASTGVRLASGDCELLCVGGAEEKGVGVAPPGCEGVGGALLLPLALT